MSRRRYGTCPPTGGLVQNVYTDTTYTEILYYRGQGDSTMWTSTYGATQALRYAVTGEAAAKANTIAVVETLRDHLRVTRTEGYVGRYVGPLDNPIFWLDVFQLDEFRYGEGIWLGTFYLSNSSSDQYDGFFNNLATIYDLVDDAATRQLIKSMIKEVIDKLAANRWLILNEEGLPTTAAPQIAGSERISFALIAAHIIDTPEYWQLYEDVYEDQIQTLPFSSVAFWNRYTEYFAMNLKHLNYFTIFRLEPDEERLRELFRIYMQKVRPWVEDGRQVYFDYVYLTGCERLGVCEGSYGIMERGVNSLHKFREWPNVQWFVTPPPAEVDPISQWLVDLQEKLPAFLQDLLGFELQAKQGYDLDERCIQDYMWQRSPYKMSCGPFPLDWPEHMLPGADYLMAYWLGRHTGYLTPHDIDAPPGDDDDDNDDTTDDDAGDDDAGDDDAGDDDAADDDTADDDAADDDNDDAAGSDDESEQGGCGC
ncbi:MAG: hypothetical protein P9L99_10530 [Candidatus Lernaella stagnicola]|nr:hypothetical protein [Candidatus Lernaella stagnicola]